MRQLIPRLMLLGILLTAVFVYRPGLNGPFMFDDGINVSNNEKLKVHDLSKASLTEAAFSIPNGVFRRPLSMLSFAFNFYFDRDTVSPFPDAFSFKVTNLLIHLLNSIAVFILTRLLVSLYRERRQPDLPRAYTEWLALAVTAAWLLHPLNLTSVLYVVQRMTSLAALFTFSGLSLYLWGRARLCRGQQGGLVAIMASVLVFTPLAVLSKENGILLPFLMLAAEVVLFRFETARPSDRRFLITFFIVFAALPALLIIGYLAMHPNWILGGYIRREFTLPERLMTEARVIWFYLRLILLPSTALMGVYHDDFAISHHLFDPVTTLPAILGILALLGGVWLLRQRMPIVAFGILFFLVGHSIESSFVPLELMHEHRNYLPMYGIVLAFFYLLLEPFRAASARLPRRAAAVLMIVLFAASTMIRANAWSNSNDLWSIEVEHHPASTRANNEMGDLYANALTFDPVAKAANYPHARYYYERVTALKPNNINGLVGLIRLSEQHGKPVEEAWLKELDRRLAHEAIPANTNDQLMSLAFCQLKEKCPLKAGEIDQLLHAPLQNPHVTGRGRALIYSVLTIYFFNIKHDHAAALEAIRHAIKLDPQEIDHHLWLATILVAMHRSDEAREQITLLKQLDRASVKAKDIAVLEKQLIQGS